MLVLMKNNFINFVEKKKLGIAFVRGLEYIIFIMAGGIDMEYMSARETADKIIEMYRLEGWTAYLQDDAKQARAWENSIYCLGAFEGERLIGFVRCVGDGEHILLVQDLMVYPSCRREKIGTELFRRVWDKYADVRMFQVNTDIEDEMDNRFYQSFYMKKLEEGHMVSYFR